VIIKIVTLIFQLHVCSKHGYPDARIHGHKTRQQHVSLKTLLRCGGLRAKCNFNHQ